MEASADTSIKYENEADLFSQFQTVVHLSEDLKSNHIFIVMGASVCFGLINPFFLIN